MNEQDNLFAAVDKPMDNIEIVGQQVEIVGQQVGANIPEGAATKATVPVTANQGQPPPSSASESTSSASEGNSQPSYIEPKADLIVGATGSGKTVNIGRVADWVLAKYGKLTRMASTDPSGAGPLIGKVKAGQIEFWAPHAWPKPIEAMYKSTLGYWPLDVADPTSPLVEPDAGTFEVYGFGAFEGLTSYGDEIITDLKKNKATLSQDPSYTWRQGDFETSGGNQSYYGMMQDVLKGWVGNTHLLRYEKVLWSALESRGDDQSGSKVFGPMIGGKKATGKAGQWFVNFFHMDIIAGAGLIDKATGQNLIETKHVLFLKTHIDPLTMTPFPCKVRAPIESAGEIPPYLASGDVAEAYRLLDKLYAEQEKDASAKLNEIAGLRERLMEKAARAKLAEQAAAERRAKAANLLKPMVSVPGVPAMPVAAPVKPVVMVSATVPKPLSSGVPTIQNVRKK